MTGRSLLIAGCGDLGQRVGRTLTARDWQIHAIRRNPDGQPPEFDWYSADHSIPGSLHFVEALRPDFVIATFNPTSRDIAGYWQGFSQAAKNLLSSLQGHRPQHVIMVSSTRVYAEAEGGWVDESAPLSESDERALAIIDAEQQFLTSGLPATVVRFAGIYGGSSQRLVSRVARGEIAAEKPVRYTNRIHREDCAGLLVHLLELADKHQAIASIYNGVDDKPCSAHEVEQWLAQAMGVPVTATTRSENSDKVQVNHKRCRNQLLHACGYELRFPDYRAGYSEVLSRS
ncbi:MAG: NAD(P)H-binding protein [Halioglobus sp.]